MIATFVSQSWVQRLGWTLLHFLWQGTAIVIVYAILRSRMASAKSRYNLACVALAAMTVMPPVTLFLTPDLDGIGTTLVPDVPLWTLTPSTSQPLLTTVVVLWLLGVLAFSIRLFGGWRLTTRLRSTAHPAPPEWQHTLEKIATQLGAAMRPVRLMISSLVDVPTAIGWLHPVILVPVEFLTGWPGEHIIALLAHELAHIRRRDYLVLILQSIAEAVLFYHPAVWWVSDQIRAERELCCDDLAVAASGDAVTYARALAGLELQRRARLKSVLAANGGSLVNRIRRLIEPSHAAANNLPGPAAAWAMTLLWLAGLGVASVHAALQIPAPARPVMRLQVDPLPLPQSAPTPLAVVPITVAGPVTAIARHARNTLLYDPFLPAPQNDAARDPLPRSWREWLDTDVVYIITDEERSAFLQLKTDDERSGFVEQFWLRRDPTPGTVENEFRTEHYRRIAYANQHFGSSILPGSQTDRGRIYIKFGPSDEIQHQSGDGQRLGSYEHWRYRDVDGAHLDFQFDRNAVTGEYRLKTPAFSRGTVHVANPTPNPLLTQGVRFRDLAALIGTRTASPALPMKVSIDYLRVSRSSTIAMITVQFENQDLQFQEHGAGRRAVVRVLGRVRTLTQRPVSTFERQIDVDAPGTALRSVFQESIPVSFGLYRLDIVAQDSVSGNVSSYEAMLDAPRFEDGKLTASSLIFADSIQKVALKSLSNAMFVVGDTKVRPRPGNTFSPEEKLGIYLQVYNFTPDASTPKPSGSIEYQIENVASGERVVNLREDIASIPDAAASQVTIEKLLPLKTFQPGAYTLRITVKDNNGNQTLQREGNFVVRGE